MTSVNDHALFFERPYPSANAVLLRGPAPVLVDPGFGSDVAALVAWLESVGTPAEQLALVVNTHFHSDHVGGNHRLQCDYGIDVAAHVVEADMVNRRDGDACAAAWLHQPVESYQVDRPLSDGDVIDTGSTAWNVVYTPGHTRGHLSLYAPDARVLVIGDAFHDSDVGWLNPYREGADSLECSLDSLARLAGLTPRLAFSGHGPAIGDPLAAIERARRRLERWRRDPEGSAWHAAKRIFAYALMIENGLDEVSIDAYLRESPWVRDIAAAPFSATPESCGPALIAEMLRSGAAEWRDGRLIARGAHVPPPARWAVGPTIPSVWPAAR